MDLPPLDLHAMLTRISQSPYVIEAPATPTATSSAAVVLMARFGMTLDFAAPAAATGAAVSDDDYRKILADVRANLADKLLSDGRQRIEIVDHSAPDHQAEIARVAKLTNYEKAVGKTLTSMNPDDARTYLTDSNKRGGRTCVVSPLQPRIDIDQFMARDVGVAVDRGAMTAADFHGFVLYHEVGHCLLGRSELKADVFAALMTVRHTAGSGQLLKLAKVRESSEMQLADPFDIHHTSKGLWKIARMEEQLRLSPEFMALDVKAIADLAGRLGDRYEYTPEETHALREVRVAWSTAMSLDVHFTAHANGVKPVNIAAWMTQHKDLAPLARMVDLTVSLARGTDPGEAPPLDSKAFLAALKRVAAGGDPTAQTIVQSVLGFDAHAEKPGLAKQAKEDRYDPMMPLDFARSERVAAMADAFIACDPATQVVCFSKDNRVFAVKDSATGRVVSAGKVDPTEDGYNVSYSQGRRPNAPAKAAEAEAVAYGR